MWDRRVKSRSEPHPESSLSFVARRCTFLTCLQPSRARTLAGRLHWSRRFVAAFGRNHRIIICTPFAFFSYVKWMLSCCDDEDDDCFDSLLPCLFVSDCRCRLRRRKRRRSSTLFCRITGGGGGGGGENPVIWAKTVFLSQTGMF